MNDGELATITQINGWLSDAIINAYIFLLFQDLQRGREALGLHLPFYCAKSYFSQACAQGTCRRPFKLRGFAFYEERSMWFPEVILLYLNESI